MTFKSQSGTVRLAAFALFLGSGLSAHAAEVKTFKSPGPESIAGVLVMLLGTYTIQKNIAGAQGGVWVNITGGFTIMDDNMSWHERYSRPKVF